MNWCQPLLGDDMTMRTARCDLLSILLIYIYAVCSVGCSSLSRKTPGAEDLAAMADARIVLFALGSQNDKLTNFKGIGKIKVWQHEEKKIDERIAWIGSQTVKLSIVVLISGLPAVKIASDGKWFYYYEARQGEPIYKKTPASDATLQRILSIPIKTGDIIQLLAGRAPLRSHDAAGLHRHSPGSGYVLTLKKQWYGIIEKVFLAEDKTQVHQIEFFNRSGTLIYRARFDAMRIINGYRVPAKLSISNDEGVGFELEVQKYWADVPVSPSMFVLQPPN